MIRWLVQGRQNPSRVRTAEKKMMEERNDYFIGTYLGVDELFEDFVARAIVVAPLPDGSGRLELDPTFQRGIPRSRRIAGVASDPWG